MKARRARSWPIFAKQLATSDNVKLVSERPGHSSAAFTMDTYTHLMDNAQAEAAERLADLLGNGASKSDGLPGSVPTFDQKELVQAEGG